MHTSRVEVTSTFSGRRLRKQGSNGPESCAWPILTAMGSQTERSSETRVAVGSEGTLSGGNGASHTQASSSTSSE